MEAKSTFVVCLGIEAFLRYVFLFYNKAKWLENLKILASNLAQKFELDARNFEIQIFLVIRNSGNLRIKKKLVFQKVSEFLKLFNK